MVIYYLNPLMLGGGAIPDRVVMVFSFNSCALVLALLRRRTFDGVLTLSILSFLGRS